MMVGEGRGCTLMFRVAPIFGGCVFLVNLVDCYGYGGWRRLSFRGVSGFLGEEYVFWYCWVSLDINIGKGGRGLLGMLASLFY